jgi:hypothetical protein
MEFIFEPFVGVGPLKFGMSKSEVELVQSTIDGIGYCDYKEGKLSAFTISPADLGHLFFFGEDVLQMGKLPAALCFAGKSDDYGQAQGGSLYFMDLGCAILQFECEDREFLFFDREHETGEPLMKMTIPSIKHYYAENTWDD